MTIKHITVEQDMKRGDSIYLWIVPVGAMVLTDGAPDPAATPGVIKVRVTINRLGQFTAVVNDGRVASG